MSARVGRGPVGISPRPLKIPSTTITAAITIVTNMSTVIGSVYLRERDRQLAGVSV